MSHPPWSAHVTVLAFSDSQSELLEQQRCPSNGTAADGVVAEKSEGENEDKLNNMEKKKWRIWFMTFLPVFLRRAFPSSVWLFDSCQEF